MVLKNCVQRLNVRRVDVLDFAGKLDRVLENFDSFSKRQNIVVNLNPITFSMFSYFLSKSTRLNLSSKFISSSVILVLVVVSGNEDFIGCCGTFVLNFSFFHSTALLLELANLILRKVVAKIFIF
jgi:hypothetical protein